MKINSTASYAPSYTANYAEAQAAQSKAGTKVMVMPYQGQGEKVQILIVRTPREKSPGMLLNAKA